jgi:hypothetical protein
MTSTFWVVLACIFVFKVVVFGPLLYFIFRDEIKTYFRDRKSKSSEPRCIYCQSVWTTPVGESEPRWDGEELVMTTTYECQHCHLPFWHVERVPMVTPSKR